MTVSSAGQLTHMDSACDLAYRSGADAAIGIATSAILSPDVVQAVLIGDPDLLDACDGDMPCEPNLSGEWADGPTPHTLACELLGDDYGAYDDGAMLVDALCEAWERGRDCVWWRAIEANAHRVTGNVATALELEAGNDFVASDGFDTSN